MKANNYPWSWQVIHLGTLHILDPFLKISTENDAYNFIQVQPVPIFNIQTVQII